MNHQISKKDQNEAQWEKNRPLIRLQLMSEMIETCILFEANYEGPLSNLNPPVIEPLPINFKEPQVVNFRKSLNELIEYQQNLLKKQEIKKLTLNQ